MADPKPALTRQELPNNDLSFRREVGRRIDGIQIRGDVQWCQQVTLTADGAATTTSVTCELVTTTSQVSFQPMTPEAATLLGKIWITAADYVPGTAYTASIIGRLTINHPALVVGQVATLRISVKG